MVHPDEFGSATERTWLRIDALARRVVRRGHEIRLVHFPLDCKPEQLTEAQLEPGLTTIGFSRWRGQLFANCKRMCELAEWADVIHFAQSDFRSALPAVYASYMAHKPLHYDWDRWDLAQYKNAPGRKPLFGRHAWLIEEALMPGLADTVSISSGGLYIMAQGYGVHHTSLIEVPNGADVTCFHPANDGGAIRRKYAIEGPLVTTVANLQSPHGVEQFLHVARRLVDRHPDLSCMVIGGGSDYQRIFAMAADMGIARRLIFTGAMEQEAVAGHLAASDVLVSCLPNNDDTRMLCPMRIAEAMSAGKPIVASHVGELERMLEGAGILTPPEDPDRTADAVESLLADPDRGRELGRQGRKRAVDFYNWELSASNLVRGYEIATHRHGDRNPWIWQRLRRFVKNNRDIMGTLTKTQSFVGPTTIQVDLTNDCNTDCVACWCRSPLLFENHMPAKVEDEVLPLEMTKQLLDDAADLGVKEIYYAGGGEPFMHPDILEILEYTKDKGMVAFANTNFIFMDEDVIEHVIDIGLDHFTVSMWAGSGPVYALTHPNQPQETFYEVKEMLTLLNRRKAERGTQHPLIKVYHVISKLNYHEMEEMIQFCCDTDSESVEFTLVDTVPGKTDYLLLDEEMRQELYQKCLEIQSKQWIRSSGKPLELFRYDEFIRRVSCKASTQGLHDKNIIDALPCYVGWLFARVLPNGNINFCLKAHRIPNGNLFGASFKEIWTAQKQQDYRQQSCVYVKEGHDFFTKIGNDPQVKVGCYKSCDDLGRNQHLHGRWMTMPLHKRAVLHAAAKLGVMRGQTLEAQLSN